MEEAAKQAFGMLDNPQETPGSCTICFFFFCVCVFEREDTVKNVVHNWVSGFIIVPITRGRKI